MSYVVTLSDAINIIRNANDSDIALRLFSKYCEAFELDNDEVPSFYDMCSMNKHEEQDEYDYERSWKYSDE